MKGISSFWRGIGVGGWEWMVIEGDVCLERSVLILVTW